MQNVSIPLFVSSDPLLGAFNINAGVSRFDVQFKNSIEIPDDAQNITLQLTQSTVFWTVLNVKAGINDLFHLITTDGGSPFTLTIPPGLYAPIDLNDAISRGLINAGVSGDYVTLTADNSTGKILLTLDSAGLQVDWIPQSFFSLLGFNAGQLVPAGGVTTGQFSELAPNVAAFSDVSSFLAHTDLLQSGIPIGDLEAQVLAQIQITVPPGSQINFQPQNPIKLSVNHLRGQIINQATFFITDQLNREVDFNTENFTMLVELKYLAKETAEGE